MVYSHFANLHWWQLFNRCNFWFIQTRCFYLWLTLVANQLFSQNGLKEMDRNTLLWVFRNRQQGFFRRDDLLWGLLLQPPPWERSTSKRALPGLLRARGPSDYPETMKEPLVPPRSMIQALPPNMLEFWDLQGVRVTLQSSVIFRFWDLLILLYESTMKGHFKEKYGHTPLAFFSQQDCTYWS